jgi:cytochrome c-type biogenesis protein CcmH
MLWMILTLMTVLAAVGLAIPLVRRVDAARAAQRDDSLGVLKAQLGEIETQAATGVLEAPEAEASSPSPAPASTWPSASPTSPRRRE